MENNENKTADYDRVYSDMLALRESLMKLSRADRERLIRAAVPVWAPKTDPIKAKFITAAIMKLLG